MFEKPTLNDFISLQRDGTSKALSSLEREVTAIGHQYSAKGIYGSGGMIRTLLDAAEKAFYGRLDDVLADLRRVTREGHIDAGELRNFTFQYLRSLPELVRGACGVDTVLGSSMSGSVTKAVDDRFSGLAEGLNLQLRQFDIGWSGNEPDQGRESFVNSGVFVGAVQQGSPSASMNVTISINFDAAKAAAEELSEELLKLPSEVPIVDMRADVDTLRSQLSKSAPSQILLAEAGRSLRNIAEGVAAGLLSQPALTA